MKTVRNTFFRSLIFGLLIICCAGCLGTKKTISNTSKSTKVDSVSVKKDSVKLTTVNSAIDDRLAIKVAASQTNDRQLDSLVNDRVDFILSQINTNKSSGDNSYRLYYDRKLREMRAEFTLGETKNEATEVSSETDKTSSETLTTEQEIKKVIYALPWWVWVLAAIFLIPRVIELFKSLTPLGAAVGLVKKKQ